MSWPLVELGNLAEFINGFAFKPKDWQESGKKIIRIQNLTNPDKEYNLTELGVPNKYNVTKGDILVSWSATLDVFEWSREDALLNQHIFKVVPDYEKVDKRYFKYALKKAIDSMLKFSRGSTMKHVNRGDFLGTKIPLPPLEEQKRIAAILDKADSVRRKRQQAIDLADDFLRSVFLDMFGDPVSNPKGWKVKPIKYGLKEVKAGWSAKGESYPCKKGELGVLKISAVTSGVFKPSENKFVNKSLAEGKNLVFPSKGDLLFSRANTRELVAATCIVTESERDVFLPDKLWKITPDCSLLLPEFLHFMIQQPRFKNLLTSQATGTSGSMLNISKDKFENSIGIYPPIDMQEKFKSVFWKVNSLLNAVKTSNSKLNDNFNSLSQKAFAGEL